ncbi:MAG: TIGR01777 family oxidoreductase [Terriglobia bacterium]
MKFLITGSTGFIGSALVRHLREEGHAVVPLLRTRVRPGEKGILWDIQSGTLDPRAVEGFDVVVHLAGESIGAGRWTLTRKATLRHSRVKGTRLLAETLASLAHPPKVLVCASAMGFYGDRGDEILTEESSAGTGFLAELCQEWEAASEPAAEKGIRVTRLRIGLVLGAEGGALKQMLPPFRFGVGGRLGSGRQFMSWIALDDLVAVIEHAVTHDSLAGAVNAAAPNPVTNREFTTALGRVLDRPTIFPVPSLAVRILFGEMGDALLLSSARLAPARLLASGFQFRYPELEAALRHALHKPAI